MIQQEENMAMSVNTISNGISTILIVPHHWCTIVVPMWVIPLFWTHEALITYDNILSPRYILSSTCWQSTQTLSDVWSTEVLPRESVNGGKLFSAKSDLSQPREINLWGNEEDLPQGMYVELETVYTSTCLSLNVPFKVKRITCTTKSSSFLSIF